jgi:hypothetical protein
LQNAAALFSPLGNLWSAQGVQQGSPLGPLFFNLAIHDIIRACPGSLDWYLDDGTLLGRLTDLEGALHYLRAELTKIGLEVNLLKCSLWGPATNLQINWLTLPNLVRVKHIPWSPGSGTTLLGLPVHFPTSRETPHMRQSITAL